jgi:hypothetical protein
MKTWLLFVPITIALAGCSSSSSGTQATSDAATPSSDKPVPPGPCDQQNCNVAGIFTCWEWSTNDAAGSVQQQKLCTDMGGTVGGGACPKDKQVAGCRTALVGASDGCSVTWGYPPVTADDVKSDCTDRSGVLVNP